ncbi:MAG: chemotaxis protein CheX [Brevinematia bacterium]
MNPKEISYFLSVINDYFTTVSKAKPETGVPFLKEEHSSIIQDMTGIIGISGLKKGAVYFTASKEMLLDLYKEIFGSNENPDTFTLADLVGEISNTISGNLRDFYGEHFLISVPIVCIGKETEIRIKIPIPVFVIPIKWKNHTSYLVAGLEEGI